MCKLIDLSLGGAFLDIGWSALTRDQPVELALTIASPETTQVYRLQAKVTRITAAGAAVRFVSLDVPSHRALSAYVLGLARRNNTGGTDKPRN